MPSKLSRLDPARIAGLQRTFMTEMRRRFDKVRLAVIQAIWRLDVLGLEEPTKLILHAALPARQAWRFKTDAQKLESFNTWVQGQVNDEILDVTQNRRGMPWTAKYIDSAYRQGVVRAYVDTHPEAMAVSPDFYRGSREQFLSSAFSQPERLSKLRFLYTRSFEELKGITAAMSQQMSRILASGLANGKGPRAIARELSKNISGITKKRALVLARTETAAAHAEGQLDGFKDLGVEEVGVLAEWSTAGDDLVCELCGAREGEILEIDEARGQIPLHPNCRCAWVPVVADKVKGGKEKLKAAKEKLGPPTTPPKPVVPAPKPVPTPSPALPELDLAPAPVPPPVPAPAPALVPPPAPATPAPGLASAKPIPREEVKEALSRHSAAFQQVSQDTVNKAKQYAAGSDSVNVGLRTGEWRKGAFEAYDPKDVVAALDEVFDKTVGLQDDTVVYRLVDDVDVEGKSFLPKNKGETYVDKGFASTSADLTAVKRYGSQTIDDLFDLSGEEDTVLNANRIIMEIRVPAETRAIAFPKGVVPANYSYQEELLLDRGLEYRLVEKGVRTSVIRGNISKELTQEVEHHVFEIVPKRRFQ